MAISRWEPVGTPLSVHEAAHRLFDERVWWPLLHAHDMVSTPMDVYANGDGYVVELAVSGVKPDDIDIQLTGTTLSISGEVKSAVPEGYRYLVCQRRAGRFQMSVTLPDAADAAQIKATSEHGLLRLEVPKSEASKPKRIALKTGN